MKILVVDDEQDICEILQYNLETEGYEVVTANSAEEALELSIAEYGLILLDVMMGEMSGFQMARRLKENTATAHIPIIFITALDGEDNTVKGLNIGADDYIAKPLSMKEVKARVRAVLRRTQAPAPLEHRSPARQDSPSFMRRQALPLGEAEPAPLDRQQLQPWPEDGGGLTLNLDAKTATLDGKVLALTKLEFELLALFLQNPGKVFGRNDLLERCWPHDVYVLDRTVDVNITRLRKKIGVYGKHIKTRVGYGYCFEK